MGMARKEVWRREPAVVVCRSGSQGRLDVCWRSCWQIAAGSVWSEVVGEESSAVPVGGAVQCVVTAWPGDERRRGKVVRASTLAGMVAAKG